MSGFTAGEGVIWQQLVEAQRRLAPVHMRDQFSQDEKRFSRYSLQVDQLFLDYSRNRLDDTALALLIELASQAGIAERRDAMFAGDPINTTEGRAVLHTALRATADQRIEVAGRNVVPDVYHELERMAAFVEAVRSGKHRGATGAAIKHVVNIGIGGSDLGPAMVADALKPYASDGPAVHFVSNVDPAQIHDTLAQLDPQATLIVVVSKTFTTQETMANAAVAQRWLEQSVGENIQSHLVAVTTKAEVAREHGFADESTFLFWDWVGGRYSLWSSVGVSIALAIGMPRFRELLAGAQAMDEHFRTAPLEQNMPVVLAMLGVWYRNFWGAATHAVLPYSQRLHRLPAYLQQLDMESNGKRVRLDGQPVACATGPVIWGEPGTNGQHAFYQLLHQGSDLVPCDILFARESDTGDAQGHRMLIANAIAQGEALMRGKESAQLRVELRDAGMTDAQVEQLFPHRSFPGNKPSNTLVFDSLSPRALGNIIALYEHKVFCQGVIWGVNSFDQWGVELGKQLAKGVLASLTGSAQPPSQDSLLGWVLRD